MQQTYPPLTKAFCRHGAEIGRRSVLPGNRNIAVSLHLVRLKWMDFDYDTGGAYWGWQAGTHIYRASGSNTDMYVRAKTKADAKRQIRERLPLAVFLNSPA